MTLTISAPSVGRILEAARAAYPDECCGLLVGTREGDGVRVARVVAAANVAEDAARRFEVDPAVLLASHREAREAGVEVLGAYHSHPDGTAEPSATDLARAREDGEVWVIVPVLQGRAGAPRAFAHMGGRMVPVEMILAGD